MSARPKMLDLYCCEGGARKGYADAGFDVYGVDLFKHKVADRNGNHRTVGFSQKRYQGPSHQGDVLAVLDTLLNGGKVPFLHRDGTVEWLGAEDFAAVHASPPCQHASAGTRAQDRSKYPALIEPTRARLIKLDLPYVIENVSGAALRDPLTLCGTEFGLVATDEDGTPLEMWRHRLFESNVLLAGHGGCQHGRYSKQVAGSYGGARRDKREAREERHGGYVPSKAVQQALLRVDWMTEAGMHQCIPPIYAEHLGRQLLAVLAQ